MDNCEKGEELLIEKQPHIVVIAKNLEDIQSNIVVVANQKYYFENSLEAVEVCFFFFMGMDILYPPKSHHVWYFIQRAIFNIRIESQQAIPAIEELCNQLHIA